MNTLQYIFLFLIFWASCTEPIDELPPCNSDDPCAEDACQPENCIEETTFVGLDTLWSMPISGSISNAILDDNQLFFNLKSDEEFKIANITIQGKMRWEYRNNLPNTAILSASENSDILVGQYFNRIYSVNSENGEEISNSQIELGIASTTYGYILGDFYYTGVRRSNESEAYLVRSPIQDLNTWEVVYTITRNDVGGSRPNVESVNRWIDPITQDEILVFQHRMSFPNRVDLAAYNLTADSVLWWHPEIDEDGNSNIRQITISQGRAYFQGTSKLRCFDIASGELIWETNYGPWNQGGKFFAMGGIVFTASEEIMVIKYANGLLALNAMTGEELWDKNDDDIRSISGFTMTMYNDIVFFTHPGNGLSYSGPLWAIRASDGEEIWMKSTEFGRTGNFNGPVLIDEERLLFYTRHEGNLIAFRMPDDMY